MRKPDLSNDAFRVLKKLDKKQFLQVGSALFQLITNPRPHDSIDMGDKKHFRQDVGEFRIIYFFDDQVVSISVIDRRNDDRVYKKFQRK
jgi:mRNA interferase RelE/StbE